MVTARPIVRPRPALLAQLAPGLAVVGIATAAAYGLTNRVPALSPLIWAIFIGIGIAFTGRVRHAWQPGIRFASRNILRVGVALLGLRLAAPQLLSVGLPGLGVLGMVVPVTLLGTIWVGRKLGCSPALSLLIGTGSAICGASAIVAVDAVSDSDEGEVSMAVATVTLFGTLAMVVLPLASHSLLHLSPTAFGTWAGASIHEVAQVVAAANAMGNGAVRVGTIVKLSRVLMLAPLVLAVSAVQRTPQGRGQNRLPVPLFVIGFVAFVGVSSVHLLPPPVANSLVTLDAVLLTAALAGLGLSVNPRQILQLGWRPMALGLVSWGLAAGTALGGTLLFVR